MARQVKAASSETVLTLPLHYRARSYQLPVWEAFRRGIKRHVAVWHRRAGKDTTYLNVTACAMLKRVGNYKHVFPTLKQGREILWDGINNQGQRYIESVFPSELIYERNESELSITLRHPQDRTKPGSQWSIVGTDRNLNALVGGNPVGLIFSEYALQHPMAWVLAQPILRENGGWAVFPYTPRGTNHGHTLYQIAQANPEEWHSSLLTIDETRRDAEGEMGGPVVRREDVQADIDSGLIEEAFAQQEYWVSFEAPLQGAYYAQQFKQADAEGRVGMVPWQPNKLVYTAWDLGVGDSTAIWFLQPIGDRINVIDYYEFWGHGIEHYVKVLRDKPYVYARHYAPHDIAVRDWSAQNPGTTEARSRKDVAADLGLHFETVGRWAIADGIQAVRVLFPRFSFDKEHCGHGLTALREYQRLWDDKRKIFLSEPYHNFCSHAADALRTFAVGWQDSQTLQQGSVRLVAQGAPFAERMAQDVTRTRQPLRAQGGIRRG